ncbi:MAG: 4Fe-4S binding protein [Candidatus Thorarchaeota archaeon]|nr:4Fe-4S binding protein [Candidatus Thorarchaeota archaeon]
MNRRGLGRRRGFGRSRMNRGNQFGGPYRDHNFGGYHAAGPSSSSGENIPSSSSEVSQDVESSVSNDSQPVEAQPQTTSYDPTRPHVDQSLCASCAVCLRACPMGAISMDGPFAVIDQQRCAGCGVCIRACPRGAIKFGQ